MLHILFLILKIIGIILLVILGIALILVGIVLFVPVRYRIKAETTDGMKHLRVEARATWILHLVSAFAIYKDEELDWQLRIGWKKFKGDDEDVLEEYSEQGGEETMSEDSEETDSREAEAENQVEPDDAEAIKAETEPEESAQKEHVSQETTQTETVNKKTTREETTSKKSAKQTKKKQSKKKENWMEKIKCTITGFCDKIKNIKEYLMDELHIQAFLRLKNEIVVFIKRIKPDKIKGYLRFGFEDPYNTGRVLALFSVLYPFYGEHVQIYPEFEREVLEADLFMKGRVHVIHLVVAICRLYFDDNIKVAYKNLKTLKG